MRDAFVYPCKFVRQKNNDQNRIAKSAKSDTLWYSVPRGETHGQSVPGKKKMSKKIGSGCRIIHDNHTYTYRKEYGLRGVEDFAV